MSDQEIISQLRTGQQHKALVKLYAHLPTVERMVRTPQVTTSLVSDLVEQSRYLEWLELEAKRQQAKAEREAFRSALMAVVFPCWGEGVPAAEESPYPSD